MNQRFLTVYKYAIFTVFLFIAIVVHAQQIPVPARINPAHPRLLKKGMSKQDVQYLIQSEDWAQGIFNHLKEQVDPYVNRHQQDSTWIVSRLQMYWKTHHTQVYIDGGIYSHATGHAPVPTVRFTGTRDATTPYLTPSLKDIKPYMNDSTGLYLQNRSLPGKPWEWVEQSKSARIIESINRHIMGLARNAAFIYWVTGKQKYADFAFDIFDTYMTGMYYRKEPIDLSHGHHQTLVGLSSFEVIHEDILDELTPCYDFLHGYLQAHAPQKLPIYAMTFKKWADLIIKNGVSFNNWDLFQARFVAEIALQLDNNENYKDGKGFQYYLNTIMNKTSARQWSIRKLLDYGYGPNGIWDESPGYSKNVVSDFLWFVSLYQNQFGMDLLKDLPILSKAVLNTPQYLYPNRYIVAFGDTHYERLRTDDIVSVIENARTFREPRQEKQFTQLYKFMRGDQDKELNNGHRGGVEALLSPSEFTINDSIPAGTMDDFVTPTFYAPGPSWFVQRNGTDPQHGLMISEAGSNGNHAHANGIAMELYGEGVALAPEGGIGTSYFQPDYDEYYARFPAHNTVVVDGISNYPVMRSHHPFTLKSSYPTPGEDDGYFPDVTFSDVYSLDPETNSDQNRVMSIVRTGGSKGYYVDIFRSRKKEGEDKYHDYLYHNLGQFMKLTDASGHRLNLKPTRRLSFDDGDLVGYDYFWDKKSTRYAGDFEAQFKLKLPSRNDDIYMNMWMKGFPDRDIFSVKAPHSTAFRHSMIPDSIARQPLQTVIVRQHGPAWNRPFVAVYEPTTSDAGSSIASISSFSTDQNAPGFVGITVENKGGSRQHIFSSDENTINRASGDMIFKGMYGIISETSGDLNYLFLGSGQTIGKGSYLITASEDSVSAVLARQQSHWYFTASQPVTLTMPDSFGHGKVVVVLNQNGHKIRHIGERKALDNKKVILFTLPAIKYAPINFETGL